MGIHCSFFWQPILAFMSCFCGLCIAIRNVLLQRVALHIHRTIFCRCATMPRSAPRPQQAQASHAAHRGHWALSMVPIAWHGASCSTALHCVQAIAFSSRTHPQGCALPLCIALADTPRCSTMCCALQLHGHHPDDWRGEHSPRSTRACIMTPRPADAQLIL